MPSFSGGEEKISAVERCPKTATKRPHDDDDDDDSDNGDDDGGKCRCF